MRDKIRNFCIIAHIDHGKSTLADRFLEMTGTIPPRRMREQLLDQMELERERGITIKLQPVRMQYKYSELAGEPVKGLGGEYILNLIDTPGHVDFAYEVSRSLAAVEGAILLVDATQGIEAQSLANLELAQKQGLTIIPVVNKIDLSTAEPEKVTEEMVSLLKVAPDEVLWVSAKTGEGIKQVLRRVVEKIPPPAGEEAKPFRALIFDARFDSYRGVITYIRVMEGEIQKDEKVIALGKKQASKVLEVGYFQPELKPAHCLKSGEIGYLVTGFKDLSQVRVGDTMTWLRTAGKVEALPGYRTLQPLVYASLFPRDRDRGDDLKEALAKLQLSDAALTFTPESSEALGSGFRCGFLGLLHLEIVKERLKREFALEIITVSPSVSFQVKLRGKTEKILIRHPSELPRQESVEWIEEPQAHLEVVTPPLFLGAVTELVQSRGGALLATKTLTPERLLLTFQAPLRELVVDFHDQLKSRTKGLSSESFWENGYKRADLARLEIQVNGRLVPPFVYLVERRKAYRQGRLLLNQLKTLIPRQLFRVILQAAVDSKIVAREEIPPLRKDVLAKLYGGDRTRKDKLLAKQRQGKKRLAALGEIEIPPEAFQKLLFL